MGIRLMSDIPDNFIFWQIQGKMQSHSEFNSTQVGSKMPTSYTDFLYQKIIL